MCGTPYVSASPHTTRACAPTRVSQSSPLNQRVNPGESLCILLQILRNPLQILSKSSPNPPASHRRFQEPRSLSSPSLLPSPLPPLSCAISSCALSLVLTLPPLSRLSLRRSYRGARTPQNLCVGAALRELHRRRVLLRSRRRRRNGEEKQRRRRRRRSAHESARPRHLFSGCSNDLVTPRAPMSHATLDMRPSRSSGLGTILRLGTSGQHVQLQRALEGGDGSRRAGKGRG